MAQICAVAVVFALLGLLVWELAHNDGGDIAAQADKGKIVAAPDFTRPRVDTVREHEPRRRCRAR